MRFRDRFRPLFPDGFPPAEPAPSVPWSRGLAAAFGLSALVLLLYWPAVDFGLLAYDDPYYTRNNLVTGGLNGANIVHVFTELPEENLFIPLTHLSLMADVELFGLAPRGFHFTNILLFAIDMGILLMLLWRLTGALCKSAFASALVAFHPLRVESVAWVTERKGVLSVLFLLLAFACYLRYARTGRWRWYGALFFCTVLGMLAKPMVVTLPFLLLLLDFWPLGRFRQGSGKLVPVSTGKRFMALVVEKLPLVALSAIVTFVTVHIQQKEALREGISLISRAEHAFSSVFIYLFQTAWPRDLIYRFFQTPWEQFSGTLLPAAIGMATITAIVLRFAGRRPYLAFGWGWYLLALLPVSGIIPSGGQWISDRFTFIPHIGLMVAIVWLAGSVSTGRFRSVLLALAVLVSAVLAILSRRQLFYWKDGAALFGKGLEYSRQEPGYINQYAVELLNLGDYARALEQMNRIRPFAMDPGVGTNIQLNHLEILADMGNRDGAIAQAKEYLARNPRFWKTRIRLADDLLAEDRFSEAAAEYRQVLTVPGKKTAQWGYVLEGMGIALSGMGKPVEAQACYEEGLRVIPLSPSLHYDFARLLAEQGSMGEARAHFEEALRIAPDNPRIRMALAEQLLKTGAVGAAAYQFQEVARRASGKAESVYAQGRILESAGMAAEARALYENALKMPALLPDTQNAVRRRLAKRP